MENVSIGKWGVLLGVPGSGKGTLAEYLSSSKGFIVIAVGEILRRNKLKKIASSGCTIGEIIDSGALLPDEVVLDYIKYELNEVDSVTSKNVLFDGFPRTVGQAKVLADIAMTFGKEIGYVLNFSVDQKIIVKRVLGRYKCSKCGRMYNNFFLNPRKNGVCDVCGSVEFDRRVDDNEESLNRRLSEYHRETVPLIDFYSQAGTLKNIDAGADIKSVRNSVLKSLGLDIGE
ncbi:MAG: nucleoside monophosphate kinase [Holosporales bacterium]|jgi:adenylate kinase|nr:nucleoside monophosphate kinase [Holosporales bacterium]